MEVDAWEFRAIAPNATQGFVLRFERIGFAYTAWWRHYERGRGVVAGAGQWGRARWQGRGFRLTNGAGALTKTATGWKASAAGPQFQAQLSLRQQRIGPTVGPLVSNGQDAWLSVLAVGAAEGSFLVPHGRGRKRFVMRGWRGAFLRESLGWATYHAPIYARLDLALTWRSASHLTLVWGVEPMHDTQRQWNAPDDGVWRGALVRIRPVAACRPTVRRTGLIHGTHSWVQPTSTLAAGCAGKQVGFKWIRRGEIGSDNSALHIRLTGLARSSDGGIGFLEQTVPPD